MGEEEGNGRVEKMVEISKWEMIILCSFVFSWLYFAASLMFWIEYRKLRREYEERVSGDKGLDVENDLNKNMAKIMGKKY